MKPAKGTSRGRVPDKGRANPPELPLKKESEAADTSAVEQEHDVVLERLFQRYRTAMALHRNPRPDLRIVDTVLEARVMLFEHLVQTGGWEPPTDVRRQLELDALLIEQPPTAVAG